MASVYKRASKAAMDEDMSGESSEDASSGTVRADSEESEDSSAASSDEDQDQDLNRLQKPPAELRSRVLMLTSRGVSLRCVDSNEAMHDLTCVIGTVICSQTSIRCSRTHSKTTNSTRNPTTITTRH